MANKTISKDIIEEKGLITIGEAADYLRVSRDTLRRWEKRKILTPYRSPTGWRYYDKKQLDYVYAKKPDFNNTTSPESKNSERIQNKSKNKHEHKAKAKKKKGKKKKSNKRNDITSSGKAKKVFIYALGFFIGVNIILIVTYIVLSIMI